MRRFETRGPVDAQKNYIVSRTEETADFINRVKARRYVVIFAPRQTGKTTFFRTALDKLTTEEHTYFPLQLNFDTYAELSIPEFYGGLFEDIREEIETVFEQRGSTPSETLMEMLDTTELTNALSLRQFFSKFVRLLNVQHIEQRVILIIDEFDGIPQEAVSGFLNALRHIYLNTKNRCIHSIGIVGVKSITQLNYDRSISPFNIQDDFDLPNFTLEQVQELLSQYTEETGQPFAQEVIEMLHRQTGGQPFLVNRFAQILTEDLDIPKTETIHTEHFLTAHTHIIQERNVNIEHLITNIRRDPRFKNILMKIATYESRVRFNPDNPLINELTTYGVIKKGAAGRCEIANPIYQQRILQAFTSR